MRYDIEGDKNGWRCLHLGEETHACVENKHFQISTFKFKVMENYFLALDYKDIRSSKE